MEDEQLSDIYSPTDSIQPLLRDTQADLAYALELADTGVSVTLHQLDNTVDFVLDNQQEVRLRVKKIEIQHVFGEAVDFLVSCRTDFENVLILAKKLNMRIAAFATHFTVVLQASPEFRAQWNDEIVEMRHPSQFFETLDEIRRPIFLNLNHYIIARISD